jgi:hypothetical protein
MVQKVTEHTITLPKNLDVLLYLPSPDITKDTGLFVAIALQYNISAVGLSPEQVLEKLANIVSQHCAKALKLGINPVSISDLFYLAAFFMGVSMNEILADVCARASMQLSRCLGQPSIDVRSVCSLQEQTGLYDLGELVTAEK